MPSGGAHNHMKAFSSDEDAEMLRLFNEHGPKWKLIASFLQERTPAMVRNRFLRMEKGRKRAADGLARNKCGLCGQIKQGHVCTKRPGNAIGAFDLQKSTLLEVREAQTENLPPIAQSRLALGSPPQLTSCDQDAGLFAPAPGLIYNAPLPPIAAACVWSPQTSHDEVEPSPAEGYISAAALAASLLAPTPEPGSYQFPTVIAPAVVSSPLVEQPPVAVADLAVAQVEAVN